MKYDFLIVGAGLFGAVCAQRLIEKGYTVLVIDKRNHIGGNVYTENVGGINVHVYGAHIFHTSNELVWNYINKFCSFNNFINSPIANYNGEIYNLPFNMNTFVKIWPDINSVDDAKNHIEEEKKRYGVASPSNLEEQAINMVGKTIYDKLIKEYTEKQWGKRCVDLPSFIIKRIPLRFEFNNNYFDDKYQGIPIGGYTRIIEKMLSGAHVILNCDFIKEKNKYLHIANKIIYTGQIDEFFDYCYGFLEYRSLKFENENLPLSNFQNNAVVNYTSNAVMYTRIIEHKHFERADTKFTIITKEYPKTWKKGDVPFYSVNNEKNNLLYSRYFNLSLQLNNVYFGGRLGQYKYFDMDDTIVEAIKLVNHILKENQDEK